MEKLISGKRDHGDRELGVNLGGQAFVASQCVPRRDLIAEKQYSRLSASTTWTRGGLVPIPRDKSSCREFSSSHSSFTFPHFILATCVPLHS